MGLGDVTEKELPEDDADRPPRGRRLIGTRSFIPHVCHDAIGVLAAVTVATACGLEGSVRDGLAVDAGGCVKTVAIEHPTGEFTVELETGPGQPAECGARRAAAHGAPADARRGDGARISLGGKIRMIIDCHGHYTTAPKALEEWRNPQIAGNQGPSPMPQGRPI